MSLSSPTILLGVAVVIALCFSWWKRQTRQRATLLAHLAHLEEKLDATALAGRRLSSQMGRLERLLVHKGLLEEGEIEDGSLSHRGERRGSTELH